MAAHVIERRNLALWFAAGVGGWALLAAVGIGLWGVAQKLAALLAACPGAVPR